MFSGDLKMLMSSKKQTTTFMKNAIIQIFFSISNFSHYTGFTHKDSHWGNFLYHKIEPGGYFYYKVNGIDVYLENIGFIWIIWDFGFAKKIKSDNVMRDYLRIIHAFYPTLYGGWIPNNITYNTKDIDFALNVSRSLRVVSYNKDFFKRFKNKIIVSGYKNSHLKKISKEIGFNTIVNKKYSFTNMVYSLFLTKRFKIEM